MPLNAALLLSVEEPPLSPQARDGGGVSTVELRLLPPTERGPLTRLLGNRTSPVWGGASGMAPRGLPKKGCCSGAGRRRPMGADGRAAGSAEAEGTTTAETLSPPASGWIASSDGDAKGVISPSPQPGLCRIHQRKIHQR